MDKNSDVVNWIRTMGYDGEIPKTLSNICNYSTCGIWDQLIQKAKPKQEVENMRNTIILHRLNSRPLNKQDEFSYPIKEIHLFVKNQELQNKLEILRASTLDIQNQINNISQKNKVQYITAETLGKKIKENIEREYLLDKKCKLLERNIQEAEETLTTVTNLTPVELEDNPSTKEITETLQQCAAKLEKLIPEMPLEKKNISAQTSRVYRSCQKSLRKATFENYLRMTEKKKLNKIIIFKQGGDINNKENLELIKVSKCLFSEKVETVVKPEIEIQENAVTNKRESLGILPNSCFDKNNDTSILSGFRDMQQDIFSLNVPLVQEHDKNFSLQQKNILAKPTFKENVLNPDITSESHITNASLDDHPKATFEKMLNNEVVVEKLKTLLFNHNRQVILNTFHALNDEVQLDITKNILLQPAESMKNKKINENDIAQLQLIHIRNELKIIKNGRDLQKLEQLINKRKDSLLIDLYNKGLPEEKLKKIEKAFERHLDDVALDSTLTAMKKEISLAKTFEENSDLQLIQRKVAQVKRNIEIKINAIQYFITGAQQTLQSITSTQNEAVAYVHKLRPFISDLSWSKPLTDNICTNEIETFEKFPLEYNRRCIYTDSSIFYRDIWVDNVPAHLDLDSNSLYLLAEILDSPFNPPETILLNILKSKLYLDALKSLKTERKSIHCHKYSLEELRSQESYVQFALDKLCSTIHSTLTSKILSASSVARKTMEIWQEMPFKDFIPAKRTVEGKEYKFYENQYDSYYNNL